MTTVQKRKKGVQSSQLGGKKTVCREERNEKGRVEESSGAKRDIFNTVQQAVLEFRGGSVQLFSFVEQEPKTRVGRTCPSYRSFGETVEYGPAK